MRRESNQALVETNKSELIQFDRRKHLRQKADARCAVLAEGDIRGRIGKLKDLSFSGAKISFNYMQHFNRGDLVSVCVNLNEIEKEHFFVGEVMWIEYDKSSDEPCSIGVRFIR